MVAKRLARHADVIVDVDAGTVERRTPLARAAAAAAARGTGAARLTTHPAAPLYSISYKGGDAWTRRCVEDALHAALADAAPPPKTSLLSRLRGSTTTWGDLARAAPHFQRWRRRAHAAAEEPAAEAPVFTETYEGERDEFGRRRGRGRCVAPDYTYDGEWAEDAAHGRGSLTTSTFSYEGTFRDGAFHGRGRWRKADGSRSYEGEFESGEFHGAGKLERRADGDDAGAWTSYVGEWRRGKRHGTGTCVYADGSTYSGEWRDGEAHGEGVRTRDGAVYRGQFVRGLRHGAGVLTTQEGDVYDGVFREDAMAPDAAFTVTYADGRRYGGRVKDGVPSGSHGMMKYADGSFYEGDFADGLRSGKGTLFEGPDLAPRTGDWRCDVLVQLRRPSDSGSSIAPSLSNWRSLDDDDDAFASASSEEDEPVAMPPTPLPRRVSGTFDEREGASAALAPSPPRAHEVSRPPRRGVARVRFPNGDVYEGAFARGLRDGRGVFEEALTGHRYEGDWVRGERDGEGEFVSGDGAFCYSGTWKKGRRAGRGRAEIHGSTYEGEWKNDAFHGTGVLVDTAGNQYEGEFQQGRKHGSGTQTYADGSKYSGEWRDGARHGTGHLVARDGSTYSGQWRDGVPSGEGTRVAATGATHRGVFADGKPHGWGVATEDGVEREGEWDRGAALEDCDWTLKYDDGRRYAGLLKGGVPHGEGVMKWASGESYAGAFVEGKRAGRGIAVFADGSVYDGLWRHDHPALVGQGKLTRADGSVVFAEPSPS